MTETERPNPDDLLAQVESTSPSADKPVGRLKVFFGAAPGVGKTYAMLEEARAQAAEGVDVLIGYAEPHIRPETEALLLGLEILPYKIVEYRGATFKEFDVDAAIARKPRLLCVDELAHSNAPGLRHQKRWQDVFDLLDAGVDVYTSLNVQHLESVNDVVERITGVAVRETLPDEVLDRADEIELIDTTPEELTQRLREGKVYRPDVAERAMRQFFNKGNLTALRELALRRTAERVDAQMREQRQKARVRHTWAASERLLVCISPSPLSARLLRSARRLASGLRAPWTAVYVDTPPSAAMPQASRDRITANLRLAQQLGGDAVTLSGENVALVLADYARQRNVTKIVIGKSARPRWRERFFGSLVEDVIRRSGDIDVYVIRGEPSDSPPPADTRSLGRTDWFGYAASILVTLAATAVGWLLHRHLGLNDTNVLMVYLLGVLGVASRYSRRASALAAVLAVLTFDFIFVQPYFSFAVSDQQYVITFLVMMLTSLLISTLVHRSRAQAALFARRQTATQSLLDFTSELARYDDADALAQATADRIGEAFGCDLALMLRDADQGLRTVGRHGGAFADDEKERAVARWVLDHGEVAGIGTSTLPMSTGAYLPLHGAGGRMIGVVGLRPRDQNPLRDPDQLRFLESLALQAATAIERASLSADSRTAWQRVEQENLRNTLLSAVSHDLRTPLTAITGAASALVEPSLDLPPSSQKELAASILSESRRMERVVSNLLEISRIESGGMSFNRQPTHLGELLLAVGARLSNRLAEREVSVAIAPDLSEISCDPVAIDQVLTNLLENAIDHTPAGTAIDLAVVSDARLVTVSISDRGGGLPPGSEQRVFEKFTRLTPATDRRGLGLGLAISKAIVLAHGGTIEATNRSGGGATFRFSLPRGSMSCQA